MTVDTFHNTATTFLLILCLLSLDSCMNIENEYHHLAVEYADYMIENGKDHYGKVHSPVFVSMLNRENDSLYADPEKEIFFERSETGIREIDRTWNGANPFNDEGLYELLYQLSDDTGDDKYRKAADESLKWLILNTQHPETGLISWGEHLGYRVDYDSIVRHEESKWADLKHEVHSYWSLWDKVFELEPKAAIDYAYAYWNYHVYDKDLGLHAHQTRYDTFMPDSGFIFPRMAGNMIYIWALTYQHSQDEKVKRDMCRFIDKIVTTHNKKRTSTTKALLFYHPDRGIYYSPFSNLEATYEIHRAQEVEIPDSLINKLEEFNRLSDQNIADSISVDTTNLWCNRYGHATSLARHGLSLMKRYLQNKNDVFRDLAIGIADLYLGVKANPDCHEYPMWPLALSTAIDLQLEAYRITGDEKYLKQANFFGAAAKNIFLDDISPLPKAFSEKYSHYEAISGGADLMLSFYKLAKMQ